MKLQKISLLFTFVVFFATACSKDLLPCPPKGIGVEDHAATTPEDQVLGYATYNCAEPQICPDQGSPFVPYYVVDENAPPAPVNLSLTNCSTGNATLEIDKIVVYGDKNCSFSEATIEKKTVAPGETVFVKTDYKPKKPGPDHAAFRIFSNAQNFETLITPFCSLALEKKLDAGVPPEAGVGDGGPEANLPPKPDCEEQTTVNTECHKE
ncbi:MAG: hypothetical protein V1754_08625 [Pseudomonadota bacterium]